MLGDAHRRALVELLAAGPASVQELADRMPISRPAVSRHLRLLKAAELVRDVPDGTRHVYQLQAEGIAAVRAYYDRLWQEATGRFVLAVENTTPRGRR